MIGRKEAMKILGVSHSTLVRFEKKGLLTPHKYDGRNSKTYYDPEQIEKLKQKSAKPIQPTS